MSAAGDHKSMAKTDTSSNNEWVELNGSVNKDEATKKGEWKPHPEPWGSKPRNIPDTPVPYVGLPSTNCAPADAEVSDRQFAQIAQLAISDVHANSWETFAQASKAASSNKTAAILNPTTDASTRATVKAADSSYRIAAATNALVTDADYKGEKRGVEHELPTFDESSDEEQRQMSKAFVASRSRQTQEGIAKLRRDLLQWTTMGAKLVRDKFSQRAMDDTFLNQIVFDDENKCYAVTEVDGVEVLHDSTQ